MKNLSLMEIITVLAVGLVMTASHMASAQSTPPGINSPPGRGSHLGWEQGQHQGWGNADNSVGNTNSM